MTQAIDLDEFWDTDPEDEMTPDDIRKTVIIALVFILVAAGALAAYYRSEYHQATTQMLAMKTAAVPQTHEFGFTATGTTAVTSIGAETTAAAGNNTWSTVKAADTVVLSVTGPGHVSCTVEVDGATVSTQQGAGVAVCTWSQQ